MSNILDNEIAATGGPSGEVTPVAVSPIQYRVPVENLAQLTGRIQKLAKRAAKFGVEAPGIVLGELEILHLVDKDKVPYIREFQHLTLSGMSVVRLNGWQLAAVLEPVVDEDGNPVGNMLRSVPEAPAVPVQYREAGNNCDHCHTQRRRNETFLVVNESSEWKQIGRQCLRDFLGHVSADNYASWAQMLLDAADFASESEADDYSTNGGRVARKWDITEVLAIAACAIRLSGWCSRKTAEMNGRLSTSGLVGDWLTNTGSKRGKDFEHQLNPSEADNALAQDVVAWLGTLSERDLSNDYIYNLSLLGRAQIVNSRQLGILCAAVSTYAKEVEREINRRKRFEADLNSQFVGVVGTRMTFENLTLVFRTEFESNFGVTHFMKFKDAAGNVIVYFASSAWELEVGGTITLVARVKKHDVRDGVKQTVITRAAVPVPPPTKEQKKAAKARRYAQRIANRIGRSTDYDAWMIMCEVVNKILAEERVS